MSEGTVAGGAGGYAGFGNVGWVCPKCNGGVAPNVQRCPCLPNMNLPPMTYPTSLPPGPWWGTTPERIIC